MRAHTRMRWVVRLLLLILAPAGAEGQRPVYAPTLYWETGLIDTPAAWVAPLGGDLSFAGTRIQFDRRPGYNLSIAGSLWGRAEAGVSFFTSDLKAALFAKALLWDQLDGEFRTGLTHWLPSVAVGLRNAGTDQGVDRFSRPNTGITGTSPTLYAVATRTVVLKEREPGKPLAQLGASLGAGNGLFSRDGGLDSLYAAHPTGGLFGGVKFDVAPTRFSTVSLIAEHNAWDVNVGAMLEVRGLRAGLFLTEVGAGAISPLAAGLGAGLGADRLNPDRSFRKVAITIGWQTNGRALLRDDRMSKALEENAQLQAQLRREIAAGTTRVEALERQLRELEGKTAADQRTQKAELEQKLKEELEALKRLQERMKSGKPPEGW